VWLVESLPITRGYHNDSGRNVLDRVISSYTPTLKALAHARERARQSTKQMDTVLVGMAQTPGISTDLPNVVDELDAIQTLIPPSVVRTVLQSPTKLKLSQNYV